MSKLWAAAGPGTPLSVLCVNPAAPGGGSAALDPYFPTKRFPGPLGAVTKNPTSFATPWITLPGL